EDATPLTLRLLELAAPVKCDAELFSRLREQGRRTVVRQEKRFRLLEGLLGRLVLPLRAEAHTFDYQRFSLKCPLLIRFERSYRAGKEVQGKIDLAHVVQDAGFPEHELRL